MSFGGSLEAARRCDLADVLASAAHGHAELAKAFADWAFEVLEKPSPDFLTIMRLKTFVQSNASLARACADSAARLEIGCEAVHAAKAHAGAAGDHFTALNAALQAYATRTARGES